MHEATSQSPGVRSKSGLPMQASIGSQPKHDVAVSASLSFAQRKAQLSRASKSNIVEGTAVMRAIERPPPGDMLSLRRSQLHAGLARRRSAYYESEFAAGRETEYTKDRVRNEAIVLAELRTNVIISDELSFITDLSYHLSNRYQRPTSSVVVNVQHGCCLMFGGSFDPAYTFTIFALPGLLQPTTNKRNAAMIQSQMHESLGVPPSRGYVRFVATPEEDVASGGRTVAGEMDELDKVTKDDIGKRRETSKPKENKKLGMRSFLPLRSPTPSNSGPEPPSTHPVSAGETPMISTAIPEHPLTSAAELPMGEKPQKTAKHRKSFATAIFGGLNSGREPR